MSWGLRYQIDELEAEVKELKRKLKEALAENDRLQDRLEDLFYELKETDNGR